MKDYLKPSLREDPDHFILLVGSNDLSTERSPELIAKSITDLAVTLKSGSREISVSKIIVPTDNTKLNEKGCEVIFHLKEICKERNLYLVDHSKKIKPSYLSRGKVHRPKRVESLR